MHGRWKDQKGGRRIREVGGGDTILLKWIHIVVGVVCKDDACMFQREIMAKV